MIDVAPTVVALGATRSFVPSALVSVTVTPPAGAGACNDPLDDSCRSLPTVSAVTLMPEAVTVAVDCCRLLDWLKPVGVTTLSTLVPAPTGSNCMPLALSGVQFWLPLIVCGEFTICPTDAFELVIDTLTGVMPARRLSYAARFSVLGFNRTEQSWMFVFADSVVVLNVVPGLLMIKPDGFSAIAAEPLT